MGYIYILTNPSFEDYIKIGYAEDIEQRLKVLNSGSHTPFSFRVYATYEVDTKLSDKLVHGIIDMLNPNLRSIEHNNGKKRVREFYKMTKEDAYNLLKAIADIHGRGDKLKLITPSFEQAKEEEIAKSLDDTTYTEEYHTAKGEREIIHVYQLLKENAAADFSLYIEPKKYYISFKKNDTNIFDVSIQRNKLKIWINVKKGTLLDREEYCRDVSNIGHWGNGDYEVTITKEDEIPYVLGLIQQTVKE